MTETQSKFRCPACGSVVVEIGTCVGCGKRYATEDGMLDFVGGRFDTQLDAEAYDAYHAINDSGAEAEYAHTKALAAHRWPASLGSVVEVGCGTGLFSRAMIAHRDAADAVLTDVSLDMLRLCRMHLTRLGLAHTLPLRLATYSAHEACFQDEAFDTCVGASVLHHIADVRAFLADVWRILKPGGRAFFSEPGYRYTRMLAMAFSDIIALLLARDPALSNDRQVLHNWVSEARRGAMLQGDLAFLESYEDKHMFIGEEFERLARDLGFATAEALPSTPDPDGNGFVARLLNRLGVGETLTGQVMQLWPSYATPYLTLLHTQDKSDGYLLWLTKSAAACSAGFPRITPRVELRQSSEAEITGGGMPIRWVLRLLATPAPEGLRLRVEGWCLTNTDVRWLGVTIGDLSRRTPVWRPRADVHVALNREGLYANWNSLCCGIEDELLFGGMHTTDLVRDVDAAFVFTGDRCLSAVSGATLQIGVTLESAQ